MYLVNLRLLLNINKPEQPIIISYSPPFFNQFDFYLPRSSQDNLGWRKININLVVKCSLNSVKGSHTARLLQVLSSLANTSTHNNIISIIHWKKVSIIITATNSLKKYTSYIYTIRSLSGDVFPLREYLLHASHFPEFAMLFVWVVQVCWQWFDTLECAVQPHLVQSVVCRTCKTHNLDSRSALVVANQKLFLLSSCVLLLS